MNENVQRSNSQSATSKVAKNLDIAKASQDKTVEQMVLEERIPTTQNESSAREDEDGKLHAGKGDTACASAVIRRRKSTLPDGSVTTAGTPASGAEPPLTPEIRQRAQAMLDDFNKKAKEREEQSSKFESHTVDQGAEAYEQMKPKIVYWRGVLAEREATILFGPTGVGKTILATQISIEAMSKLPEGKAVLYFDFELTLDGFIVRFRAPGANGFFNPGDSWRRVTRRRDYLDGETSTDDIFLDIAQEALRYNAAIVVIDNLTAIARDLENRDNAASMFLDKMQRLTQALDLAVLIVAHTSKAYKKGEKIDENHLQGSAAVGDFAENLVSITRCVNDPTKVYIKEHKNRCRPETFRVPVIVMEKTWEGGYLHFNEVGRESEDELLKAPANGVMANRRAQVLNLAGAGTSQNGIAAALNIPVSTVANDFKALAAQLRKEGNSITGIASALHVTEQQVESYLRKVRK